MKNNKVNEMGLVWWIKFWSMPCTWFGLTNDLEESRQSSDVNYLTLKFGG